MNNAEDKFAPPAPADVVRLLLDHPLAWVVSAGAEFCATLLPLRPVLDAQGRLQQLAGHFARANRHVEILKRSPRAAILLLGPHGYISPSWMQDRTQAPTWNYASAQFMVDIEFVADTQRLDEMMRDLVAAMEAQRPRAWSLEEMGERYRRLSNRIIGFHATIHSQRVKFKLGQDERDDVFADIMASLAASGQEELLSWMKRSNPGRTG